MLAEGMSISAVSRVVKIPKGTISCWFHREDERLKSINKDRLLKLKRENSVEVVKEYFI